MKRILVAFVACMLVVSLVASAKEKKAKAGPLTGTWECTSHGGPQGDMPFTLHLEQNKGAVTGSVESPMGGTDISSGTFAKNSVDIKINTPQNNYRLTGKLKKNQISGQWSVEGEPADQSGTKGTWEGKKTAAAAAKS